MADKKSKGASRKGSASPGRRLAAMRPSGTDESAVVETKQLRFRTKFVVVDKGQAPEVGPHGVRERSRVKLQAAFEGRSILNGLAYVQGNADNLIFGEGPPDAEIDMKLASREVADAFASGAAVTVLFIVEGA